MTVRSSARASLRSCALVAVLAAPLACGGGSASTGTGGSGGNAGVGGAPAQAAGGAAGQAAGGSAGHSPGGSAGHSPGGAAGRPVGGAAGQSSGGAAGRAVGGSAGQSPGGAAGRAVGGAAGQAVGGAAGQSAGGTAGGSVGGAGGQAGVGGEAGGSATGGAAGMGGAGGLGGGGAPTFVTPNLIVNGDAEAAVGSTDGWPVDTPGWTVANDATAMQYGESDYPAATDPGPPDRGANLFVGGYMDALSTLSQTADVSSYATGIDTGTLTATLSGYFGGYATQEDNAVLTATFQDGSGQPLGAPVTAGGVTSADRGGVTGLLPRTQQAAVPAGTRQIAVVLTMTRAEGRVNDGYADDLSLTLSFSAGAP